MFAGLGPWWGAEAREEVWDEGSFSVLPALEMGSRQNPGMVDSGPENSGSQLTGPGGSQRQQLLWHLLLTQLLGGVGAPGLTVMDELLQLCPLDSIRAPF